MSGGHKRLRTKGSNTMYKNCYYVILLGYRMDNNREMNHLCESGIMTDTAAMVDYAQERACEFAGDTFSFRVCCNGQSIDMDDLTYDINNKTFSRQEFCFNPADILNSFRTVEMTPAEAAAYIEKHISK